MGKFDAIKELIDYGEEFTFQYYDFEFLISDIEKDNFIVKVYCPIDVSYCLQCLENVAYKEIRKILKYANLQDVNFNVILYSGNELLNGGYYFHFTQDLLDKILKVAEPHKKFEYFKKNDDEKLYTLTIEQEPYKVVIESNGSEDFNVLIYSNLIRAYRTYDEGEVEDCSVDICTNWYNVLEEELDFYENWQKVRSLYDVINDNQYLGCAYYDVYSEYTCI